ncbi:MAG: SDR family oxidoreductase [Myxococcota bacterium]
MTGRYPDKVVWITGASSGIGASLARAFAAEGATLILSARREARLVALREQLGRTADDAMVLPLDVAATDTLPAAVEQALSLRGRIDVLINNAGISQRSLVEDNTLDAARKLMEVNFFGLIGLTGEVLPHMIERRAGHVVMMGSVASYISTPKRSIYSASKHAVRAYADSLRAEVADRNVLVTLICPGYIRTEISQAALTGDGSRQGRDDENILNGLDPDAAARRMVDAIHGQRNEFLIGGRETWAVYLKRFFPGVVARFLPRAVPK